MEDFQPMGLREVKFEELRDLYSAENQLVKALPKLAKAAEDDETSAGFLRTFRRDKRAPSPVRQIS
jgi:ferritin-like metal-binding protein YciE